MYSQEFKEKVLRRYDKTHKVSATCREFHIGRETLQRWRRKRAQLDEERRLKLYIQKDVIEGREELQNVQTEYDILRFAYEYLQPKESNFINGRIKYKK